MTRSVSRSRRGAHANQLRRSSSRARSVITVMRTPPNVVPAHSNEPGTSAAAATTPNQLGENEFVQAAATPSVNATVASDQAINVASDIERQVNSASVNASERAINVARSPERVLNVANAIEAARATGAIPRRLFISENASERATSVMPERLANVTNRLAVPNVSAVPNWPTQMAGAPTIDEEEAQLHAKLVKLRKIAAMKREMALLEAELGSIAVIGDVGAPGSEASHLLVRAYTANPAQRFDGPSANVNVANVSNASVRESAYIANPIRQRDGLSANVSVVNVPNERHDRLRLDDIRPMVNQFSGDDLYPIAEWIFHFEDAMDSANATQSDYLRFGRQMLTGSAELFSKNRVFRSWDELKVALKAEFTRIISASDVLSQLRRRHRRIGESIHGYALEMQDIARQALISEDELVQCIINGLRDNSPAIAVLQMANNVEELKNSVPKYESRRAAMQQQQRERDGAMASRGVQRPANSAPVVRVGPSAMIGGKAGPMIQGPSMSRPPICFGCSKPGHISRNCPMADAEKRPKDNCFLCNQPGHFIRDCPRQRQQRTVALIEADQASGNHDNQTAPFDWNNDVEREDEAIRENQQVSVKLPFGG